MRIIIILALLLTGCTPSFKVGQCYENSKGYEIHVVEVREYSLRYLQEPMLNESRWYEYTGTFDGIGRDWTRSDCWKEAK